MTTRMSMRLHRCKNCWTCSLVGADRTPVTAVNSPTRRSSGRDAGRAVEGVDTGDGALLSWVTETLSGLQGHKDKWTIKTTETLSSLQGHKDKWTIG